MPLSLNSTLSAESPLAATKSRMREALGLGGRSGIHAPQLRADEARQRHRFVREGEVPVVVLNSRKEVEAGSPAASRLAAAEAALKAEQQARASAERSLHDARATLQALQTRLAHAELAHSQALAAERARREQAEAAVQPAITAREAAERQVRELMFRLSGAAWKSERRAEIASARPAGKQPSARKAREPQPVKWWLPSYRAKAHKR